MTDSNECVVPLRATKDVYPLELAKEFHEGKAQGKWRTITEGAKKLGVTRTTLTRAIQVAALPAPVRILFLMPKSLTSGGAAALLEIKNELGLEQLSKRALWVDRCSAVRSERHVFDELRGNNVLPFDSIHVRITRSPGNKYLKIESAHPAFLIKYRREIQQAVRQVLSKRINAEELAELEAMLREKVPQLWRFR